jgi:Protein of unknown function, DUF481
MSPGYLRRFCTATAFALATFAPYGIARPDTPPPPSLAQLAPTPGGFPTFVFFKKEDVKAVEWKATAQLGLAASTGNAQAISLTASGAVSRRAGDNKLSAEVAAAFARSRVFVASDSNGTPGIGADELRSVTQTTSESWWVKTRYDRFFTERDALFVQGGLAADRPAGKALLAGGQLGYRRVFYERARRQLAGELGYDFTHQEYVATGAALQIHSGRAFLGYHAEPDLLIGIDSSLELLTNLNAELTPTGRVGPLGDNRIVALLGATFKLGEGGSIGLRFTAHYESAPAPLPMIAGVSFEPGFVPLADRLDTRTELVLLWRLL